MVFFISNRISIEIYIYTWKEHANFQMDCTDVSCDIESKKPKTETSHIGKQKYNYVT